MAKRCSLDELIRTSHRNFVRKEEKKEDQYGPFSNLLLRITVHPRKQPKIFPPQEERKGRARYNHCGYQPSGVRVVQHRVRSLRAGSFAGLDPAPRVRGRGQAPLSGPREWRQRAVAAPRHSQWPRRAGARHSNHAPSPLRASRATHYALRAGSPWPLRMSGRRLLLTARSTYASFTRA